jgi:putative ABC transport system ATP-binding protein
MSEGRACLEARALAKAYFPGTPDETRVLAGVSERFEGGGLHVIWGPSGSGKTTLLSLLGALDEPTGGDVVFENRSLMERSEPELAQYRRHSVGFLFQNSVLLPGMPLWANVSLSLIPDGYTTRVRRERARVELERVGLGHKIDRVPEQLSGGESHRTALARALIANPAILLVDEPTSQLDAANAEVVMGILAQHAQSGKIVVISTHDAEVRDRATRVTELKPVRSLEVQG